jgi:hypothetical protein
MARVARFALLGTLLVFAGTVPAQVAKTPAKKVDPAALRAKLVQGQFIEGKVSKAEMGSDENKLTVTYTYEVKTPNADGYKKFVEVANRYNLALEKRSTSLEDVKKLQQEVKLARAGAFIVDETPIVFELAAPVKTTVYRTLVEPPKGQAKPKTDPRYPGYPAEFKEVDGKSVRVYLNKQKLKTGAKTDENTVYPASMIVIIPSIDPVDDLKPVPLR